MAIGLLYSAVFPYRSARLGFETNLLYTDGVEPVGTKKTGKGRRKIGRKKRRMRAKIRHRKR